MPGQRSSAYVTAALLLPLLCHTAVPADCNATASSPAITGERRHASQLTVFVCCQRDPTPVARTSVKWKPKRCGCDGGRVSSTCGRSLQLPRLQRLACQRSRAPTTAAQPRRSRLCSRRWARAHTCWTRARSRRRRPRRPPRPRPCPRRPAQAPLRPHRSLWVPQPPRLLLPRRPGRQACAGSQGLRTHRRLRRSPHAPSRRRRRRRRRWRPRRRRRRPRSRRRRRQTRRCRTGRRSGGAPRRRPSRWRAT